MTDQPRVSQVELQDCLAKPDIPAEMDWDDLREAVAWGNLVAKDLEEAREELKEALGEISNYDDHANFMDSVAGKVWKKYGWDQ